MNKYFTLETPFGVEVRLKTAMSSEALCLARNHKVAHQIILGFCWSETETEDIVWRPLL